MPRRPLVYARRTDMYQRMIELASWLSEARFMYDNILLLQHIVSWYFYALVYT